MTLGLTDIKKVMTEASIVSFGINFEYELQAAALERGLSPSELAEMPGIQLWLENESDFCKADLLIWYRLKKQMENVGNDLQRKHIDRLQRQAKLSRGK